MGRPQSKPEETVVLAQTAIGGGSNQASLDQVHFHLSTANILLAILALAVFLVFVAYAYKLYKKCHKSWMRQELLRNTLRRSFPLRRAPVPMMAYDGPPGHMPPGKVEMV